MKFNNNRMMVERAAYKALEVHHGARRAGERVRFAREACGLTQDELGHAIGRSRATIQNVETGRRILTGTELVVVSRVLGVGVGWLRGSQPARRTRLEVAA